MNLRLDNKNALVCGASQGIGKAIAMQFAEMGANVTILARNEENLKKTLSELPNTGIQKHSYISGDMAEPDYIIDKVNGILDTGKIFHILVNNTGGPSPSRIIDSKPDDFMLAMKKHLIMSHLLVQTLLEGMKKEGFGRIINVISIGLKQPIDNLGVSNTARWAVAAWAKTLSKELAPFGITVNNLLPGHTATERLNSLFKNRAAAKGISQESAANEILKQIPSKRFVKPEELGYAAGFLASEEAGIITGINLPVDGGFLSCL